MPSLCSIAEREREFVTLSPFKLVSVELFFSHASKVRVRFFSLFFSFFRLVMRMQIEGSEQKEKKSIDIICLFTSSIDRLRHEPFCCTSSEIEREKGAYRDWIIARFLPFEHNYHTASSTVNVDAVDDDDDTRKKERKKCKCESEANAERTQQKQRIRSSER